MTPPYDPQQPWGQQPGQGTPSGGTPQPGWGQQPQPTQQYGGQPPYTGGTPQQPQPTQQYQPGYGQPGYDATGSGYAQPGAQPGYDTGAGYAQPGAQPQTGPQYGQPGYGQQQQPYSGSFGAQPQGAYGQPQPHKSNSALPWLLGGAVALVVVVVLFLGFVLPGFFVTRTFDQAAVERGVTDILTGTYNLSADNVTCPADEEVTVGSTFTCSATVDGEPAQITVRVNTEDGEYEVSRP